MSLNSNNVFLLILKARIISYFKSSKILIELNMIKIILTILINECRFFSKAFKVKIYFN